MNRITRVAVLVVMAAVTMARANPVLTFATNSSWGQGFVELLWGSAHYWAEGSTISGVNTPGHDHEMECLSCWFILTAGIPVSSTATETVWKGGEFEIYVQTGSGPDPGGCLDLNGDGECYFTVSEEPFRLGAEYQATPLVGEVQFLRVHASGVIEGSAVGTLDGPVADAFGFPVGPWLEHFTVVGGKEVYPGEREVESIRLEARPLVVPEPSAALLLGFALIALSACLMQKGRR